MSQLREFFGFRSKWCKSILKSHFVVINYKLPWLKSLSTFFSFSSLLLHFRIWHLISSWGRSFSRGCSRILNILRILNYLQDIFNDVQQTLWSMWGTNINLVNHCFLGSHLHLSDHQPGWYMTLHVPSSLMIGHICDISCRRNNI